MNVILPPGRIVSAVRPAPMRWWMSFPMTVVDTIFKAMSKAIPEQVIAGHHADLCVALLDGNYADTGKLFITSFGPLGGGWGAKRGEDGVSATVCINDGDTHNSPNEQFEAKYPVMVESLSLIQDSGGPGQYRGGLGVETVVQAVSDWNVNAQIERAVCLPWGLQGGLEGAGNEMLMRRDGEVLDDVPNAKLFRARVKAGDAFILRSGGAAASGRRWSGRRRRSSTMCGRAMCREMPRAIITVSSSIHRRWRSTRGRPPSNAAIWPRYIESAYPAKAKCRSESNARRCNLCQRAISRSAVCCRPAVAVGMCREDSKP